VDRRPADDVAWEDDIDTARIVVVADIIEHARV
jgi:hypothetical protein